MVDVYIIIRIYKLKSVSGIFTNRESYDILVIIVDVECVHFELS